MEEKSNLKKRHPQVGNDQEFEKKGLFMEELDPQACQHWNEIIISDDYYFPQTEEVTCFDLNGKPKWMVTSGNQSQSFKI